MASSRAIAEPTTGLRGQIKRLADAKQFLKTAIANKGVAVPDSAKMDSLSTYVNSIKTASETWVLGLSGMLTSTFTGISFVSNGETFSSISIAKSGFMVYLMYDSTKVCGGTLYSGDNNGVAWESTAWVNAAYRKLIFSAPPSDNLLTWLESNAIKQANDTAVQTEKALTITSNGTTEITPDVPYDAMSKVSVTVNIETGVPIELSTDADMEAALTSENVGKVYKFTGTSDTYITDDLYIVEAE